MSATKFKPGQRVGFWYQGLYAHARVVEAADEELLVSPVGAPGVVMCLKQLRVDVDLLCGKCEQCRGLVEGPECRR